MIQSKTQYTAICDKCGEAYPMADPSVYDDDREKLLKDLKWDGWYVDGRKVRCMECQEDIHDSNV